MIAATPKGRELTLRQAAARQGLTLRRSRRRDELALSYGTYQLFDARGHRVLGEDREPFVFDGFGATLDEVENYLRLTGIDVIPGVSTEATSNKIANRAPRFEYRLAHPQGSQKQDGWLLVDPRAEFRLEQFYVSAPGEPDAGVLRAATQQLLTWRLSKVWD